MTYKTYINNELAIKPYYYIRNGLLHVRYNVDRAIELSASEAAEIKIKLTENPALKQEILENMWNFFEKTVQKAIIQEGIKAGEDRTEKMTRIYLGDKNGFKD